MELKIIPDVINDQTIRSLRTNNSALDAARLMQKFDISAIVVLGEDGGLAGLVTERDLVRRVVVDEQEPSETELREIMTADPVTVAPGDPPLQALQTMQFYNIRHLPVVDECRVVGVVSIRDLRANLSAMSV